MPRAFPVRIAEFVGHGGVSVSYSVGDAMDDFGFRAGVVRIIGRGRDSRESGGVIHPDVMLVVVKPATEPSPLREMQALQSSATLIPRSARRRPDSGAGTARPSSSPADGACVLDAGEAG